MDKESFDKEVLSKTQPNYVLGLIQMAKDDRIAILRSLAANPPQGDRVDIMELHSFAAHLNSASTLARNAINDPDFVSDCIDWYLTVQRLLLKLTALKMTSRQTGVLKDSLNYLTRNQR